ncbi:WAT1-related protein [Melia azedarach]|uniref:WAT1-related protein n=1 Tax=Melia azedarach TaxID=155640 RepID=A0ACC1WNN7_MELAZ|nr:WAT1-related protein [Melia azedarach]
MKQKMAFDKLKPYLLMIFLQFGSAGNYIVSKQTLNRGMNRYVLVVYRNAVAALVLAPFALVLERKTRPKLTLTVFLQIMALGFLEPVLDQGFSYLGMQYTSATYTSAIMNTVPSFTFVIACIFRLERINIKEFRSQAKIIGTLVTLGGALLMTLYKGPVLNLPWSSSASSDQESNGQSSDKHWVAGTLLILLGCVAWSGFYVLQSITLKKYRAEITLSSLICFAGAIQSSTIAIAFERHPAGWAVGWDSRLFAPLYTGIVTSGITYYVQGIVMKTRDPVFVTAFNPLCMIIVAALSSIALAEKLHLGSIIGGVVIAVGLYSVVWGKSKDYSGPAAASSDNEKNNNNTAQELPITTANTGTANDGETKLVTIATLNYNDKKSTGE